MNTDFNSNFHKLFDRARKIVMTSHQSPDDDAIASILSLHKILTDQYPQKSIRMILENEPLPKYQSFAHFDQIRFCPDLINELAGIDLLVVLDANQASRLTDQPERLSQPGFKKICLDHHASKPDQFNLQWIDPQAPATAAIIHGLFAQDTKLDEDLAKIFLLGILGDTGNLIYLKPNQTQTFDLVKDLIKISRVSIQEFLSQYQAISPRIFAILKELMQNTRFYQINQWPDFQFSLIDRKRVEIQQWTRMETSEASHIYMAQYLRQIQGYAWGGVIYPEPNGDCSISLRSLSKSVNVRWIVEQMRIGGGHDQAAGGTFKSQSGELLTSDHCLEILIDWLQAHPKSVH